MATIGHQLRAKLILEIYPKLLTSTSTVTEDDASAAALPDSTSVKSIELLDSTQVSLLGASNSRFRRWLDQLSTQSRPVETTTSAPVELTYDDMCNGACPLASSEVDVAAFGEFELRKLAPENVHWAIDLLDSIQSSLYRLDEWIREPDSRMHPSGIDTHFASLLDRVVRVGSNATCASSPSATVASVPIWIEWLSHARTLERRIMQYPVGGDAVPLDPLWCTVMGKGISLKLPRSNEFSEKYLQWLVEDSEEISSDEDRIEGLTSDGATNSASSTSAEQLRKSIDREFSTSAVTLLADWTRRFEEYRFLLAFDASSPIRQLLLTPLASSTFATRTTKVAPLGARCGTESSRSFARFEPHFDWDESSDSWRFGEKLKHILDNEVVLFNVSQLPAWTVTGRIDLDMNAAIWTAILDAILSGQERWRQQLVEQGITLCRIEDIPKLFGENSLFLSHRWALRGGVDSMPIAFLQEYLHFSVAQSRGTCISRSPPPPLWVWIDNISVPQVPAAAYALQPMPVRGPDAAQDLELALRFRCNQSAIARLLWLFGELASACHYFFVHTPLLFDSRRQYDTGFMPIFKNPLKGLPSDDNTWRTAMQAGIEDYNKAFQASRQYGLECLAEWMEQLGSHNNWHCDTPPGLNGSIVQWPLSLQTNEANSGFINTFFTDATLPRRVWCLAEFLSRFLSRGTASLLDSSKWIGSLISHFFDASIGQQFQDSPVCNAAALVERVNCSKVVWTKEGSKRVRKGYDSMGAAHLPSRASFDLHCGLVSSLLTVKGLITTVSNSSASRKGDLIAVTRALYTTIVKAIGYDAIPKELGDMLEFLVDFRSPTRFRSFLSLSASPLLPYLRWVSSLLRQDTESLLLLERLIAASWDRAADEIQKTRPTWNRPTVKHNKQSKTANGQQHDEAMATEVEKSSSPIEVPLPPAGYRFAVESYELLQRASLDITAIFLPLERASMPEIHGFALCDHIGSEVAIDGSFINFMLEGAEDQIHTVIDPLNMLLDATLTDVPIEVEEKMRSDFTAELDIQKWTELMGPRDSAIATEQPSSSKKGRWYLTYKCLSYSLPIERFRIPRGAIDLPEAKLIITSAPKIDSSDDDHQDVGGQYDEIDVSGSMDSDSISSLYKALKDLPWFAVCLRPIARTWINAERAWRKDQCSAQTAVKRRQLIRCFEV